MAERNEIVSFSVAYCEDHLTFECSICYPELASADRRSADGVDPPLNVLDSRMRQALLDMRMRLMSVSNLSNTSGSYGERVLRYAPSVPVSIPSLPSPSRYDPALDHDELSLLPSADRSAFSHEVQPRAVHERSSMLERGRTGGASNYSDLSPLSFTPDTASPASGRSGEELSSRGDNSSTQYNSRGDNSSAQYNSRGDNSSTQYSSRGDNSSTQYNSREDNCSTHYSSRGDNSSTQYSSRGDSSSTQYNGARPRSLVGVHRTLVPPGNIASLSDSLAIPSSSFPSAEDSGAKANRSPTIRKGLDSFLRATKKKLHKRSRRAVSASSTPTDHDSELASTSASASSVNRELLPVQVTARSLSAAPGAAAIAPLPFVIPVMNTGPPEPIPLPQDIETWTEIDWSQGDRPHLRRMQHIRAHTTVDYLHYLVPELVKVTNCGFYWGIMDRYEAEALLENKPEGTFLLRDSSQEDFVFSVSFRRYGRSLHARVEQWNHKFSFDPHDSGVFKAKSVTTLLEHYKDPQTCMFFEPLLTRPLNRPQAFSLLHLARAVVCDNIVYDSIDRLVIPKNLQHYLKYYHYKQQLRVRPGRVLVLPHRGWSSTRTP